MTVVWAFYRKPSDPMCRCAGGIRANQTPGLGGRDEVRTELTSVWEEVPGLRASGLSPLPVTGASARPFPCVR